MLSRFDKETRAKAIRLVQSHVADYEGTVALSDRGHCESLVGLWFRLLLERVHRMPPRHGALVERRRRVRSGCGGCSG
jgi:hypothetical protein